MARDALHKEVSYVMAVQHRLRRHFAVKLLRYEKYKEMCLFFFLIIRDRIDRSLYNCPE